MTPVRIARPRRPEFMIPLAPLVDVQLLLLIFFMVTSTYLDLQMIPVAGSDEAPEQAEPSRGSEPSLDAAVRAGMPGTVLVRLSADGTPYLGGVALAGPALADALARRLTEQPGASVLVLPSARATVQSLVDILGAAAASGATAVRVVRFPEAGR